MLAKAGLAVCAGFVMLGCGVDRGDETSEILDNLAQAGFPADDIQVVNGVVYVGGDAEVGLTASREMLAGGGGPEQYRTANLVGAAVDTICVDGAKLTGAFGAALDEAIANYNALGLTFQLRRTTGNAAGCDALITGRVSGPTGGSSGFPSGGLPFNKFQIGSGLKSFSVATITHVITHELGHTVGMRHSDFFNRSISCGGQAANEGDGGIGAILIPGTPDGATLGGSLMNSCFRTVETGEFTASDVTALRALY